ncbi:sulfate adenylyltransferase [Streptomyces rimosus subsp. rimosus]|nr:sulfate adenylyltransferase [Streptomyces rimosus]KOG74709.1 sulfate adenylyltransferase [Kitasatospora aureofaciens]KOT29691.1 sulfate adenylyltransferase [Streptomyces rimosus subsp. rimosus]KOT36229.1 sulfate adenylyltransferase [Streptomyces sp. NRRL WC-3701]KEF17207.1 sulfate adenylyltransferase [Streptomyces rimosus]
MALDAFSTFAKEGGRIGSGALGSGQGGVGRCVRR